MTQGHAATRANLNALRTAASRATAAQDAIEGFGADWRVAHQAATVACLAVETETNRIRAAGFDGDCAFEMAVLGRLQRHRVDSPRHPQARA